MSASSAIPLHAATLHTTNLTLCADDFGMSGAVNAAILQLVETQRIHAVSCLTHGLAFKQALPSLLQLHDKTDIGLHLNLSEYFTPPTSLKILQPYTQSLKRLIVQSSLNVLPCAKIKASITQQWNTLCDALGTMPDFIDGHQHVQQFNGIRQILLEFLQQQGFNGWIRCVYPVVSPPTYQTKSHFIQALGGYKMALACHQMGMMTNTAFAGIYDFNPDVNYAHLVHYWLQHLPAGGLMMCHPAQLDGPDPMAKARAHEFEYLNSPDFAGLCHTLQIQLSKLQTVSR